ncbi:uncharacterized protein LOC115159172 isoform X2 [Salmo trutta]|uniref:uncharacterized protein LOC115159172 isoform X2 n=1 Tax=Salmo trutta TaxID=8032 RepID=UPI001131BED0|nr:uncharacterized protein LOC115159172 isoform X2 [Salmo trutta]
MQPLDRTVFKGLMAFYNRAADQWMTMHPGKRICIYQMARLFTKIYNKVATVERGVEGFRASGLWPLEKDIFTEAEEEVIEEPEPIAKSIQPQCSTAATSTDAATSSTTATSAATILSSTSAATSSNAKTSTSTTSTSATTSTVQPTLAPDVAAAVLLELWPRLPEARQRKRKAESAAVLDRNINKKKRERVRKQIGFFKKKWSQRRLVQHNKPHQPPKKGVRSVFSVRCWFQSQVGTGLGVSAAGGLLMGCAPVLLGIASFVTYVQIRIVQ